MPDSCNWRCPFCRVTWKRHAGYWLKCTCGKNHKPLSKEFVREMAKP